MPPCPPLTSYQRRFLVHYSGRSPLQFCQISKLNDFFFSSCHFWAFVDWTNIRKPCYVFFRVEISISLSRRAEIFIFTLGRADMIAVQDGPDLSPKILLMQTSNSSRHILGCLEHDWLVLKNVCVSVCAWRKFCGKSNLRSHPQNFMKFYI